MFWVWQRPSEDPLHRLAPEQPFQLPDALLEAAYPWAAAASVLKLQLSVRAGNGAAVALYEREGFVLEGCERNQVFDDGGFEDNLLMAKFL